MPEQNSPVVLIEELLNNVKASGNQVLERRLADMAVWFYQNRTRIPPENVVARQAFLEKSMWVMVELNALLLERVHELESKGAGKGLFLPKGLTIQGDVRRFG